MTFSSSNKAGIDFTAVFTPPSTTGIYNAGDQAPFDVGESVLGDNGSYWVYVLFGSGGVTGLGYVCVIDVSFGAVMLTTSNDTYGMIVGVPVCASAASGDYGWLQRLGPCNVRVAADAAANVDLVATATAGQLDDGVTTGPFVKGMVLTTLNGGSAAVAPAQLNWPIIDTLYEPET